MKPILLAVLVCVVAGCGGSEPIVVCPADGPHDIRFEEGSVPGSFKVYQGPEWIGSTGHMTPDEWLGWHYGDDDPTDSADAIRLTLSGKPVFDICDGRLEVHTEAIDCDCAVCVALKDYAAQTDANNAGGEDE